MKIDKMPQTHIDTTLSSRQLYTSSAKRRLKFFSPRIPALLSCYGVVALLKMTVDHKPANGCEQDNVKWTAFIICTVLLLSINMLAVMLSAFILPYMVTTSNMDAIYTVIGSRRAILCVEVACLCLTGLGTLLFIAEVVFIVWIKFYYLSQAVMIMATITGMLLIIGQLWFVKYFLLETGTRNIHS